MDLQKLKHTLFNVNHICEHVTHSRNEIKKINYDEHSHVYVDVHRLLDIFICSLMDELIVFEKFVIEENNDYLSDTLYALQPLIDYINRFDSLRIKRNKLLAHHNRDRKKIFAPWWKELQGKRFATTNEEESMIFSTVKSIHQVFVKRFPKELEEVLDEYDKEINEYEKYIMDAHDVDSFKDISPVVDEVKKRMKERDFNFTIMSKK
ncbi:hypothetical protein SAMN05443549_104146 [Flavobacterium fluvii]|uniref:HEPN AbiU2-like domain-containing protein n=1 Tax=Flavobacterium fluvii TaxID=468056 RepID=A0A1M5K1B8_9FLAO|nr:hypothetical protein [Flavobacterium fluvii]SHG46475.1 hypothetical protein SAMN05443549_104146 [Flavobacterium fluvii]